MTTSYGLIYIRGRSTKKMRRDNDVDIMNSVMNETTVTNALTVDEATGEVAKEIFEYFYWTSPKAMELFRPKEGESVTDCLVRREGIL